MISVNLQSVSKRYLYEWIIKDLNHVFEASSISGINGINGSGKSTLIKIISGYLSSSKGKVVYTMNNKTIPRDEIYQYISMAAPYTDVIQEYDAAEIFRFHTKFKKLRLDIQEQEFLEMVRLHKTKGKRTEFYSSGMRQRLQLALSILTDSKLLLLDEPTSYLDQENKKWFYNLLEKHTSNRTIIISSNDEEDFKLCSEIIKL